MSQVAVTINGRIYRLSCEKGEEERLLQLGSEVASRVDGFTESFGQVGENRLLFLAALRLADELVDARSQLEQRGGAGLDAKSRRKSGQSGRKKDRKVLETSSDEPVGGEGLDEVAGPDEGASASESVAVVDIDATELAT